MVLRPTVILEELVVLYLFIIVSKGMLFLLHMNILLISFNIAGDFMMISLPDFYRYVMGISKDAKVPNTRGSYDQWSHLHRHPDTGIIVLFT